MKVEVNNPGSNPILVNAITLKASGNAGLTGQHRVSLVTTKDTLTDSITNTTDYVHLNCKKKEVAAGATHTFYVVTWAFSDISLTAEVYTTDKSTYCQYKSTKTSNGTVSLSGNELGRLPINAATSGTVLNKWGTGNGFIVAPSNVFYNNGSYYLTFNQLESYNAGYSTSMTTPCDKFYWGGGSNAITTASNVSNFEDLGPSVGSGWRTPNQTELTLVIPTNFHLVTVGGTDIGGIAFPVGYENIDGVNANANSLTINEWAIVESRGACFLPRISNVAGRGQYWTCTTLSSYADRVRTRYWAGSAVANNMGSLTECLPLRLIKSL